MTVHAVVGSHTEISTNSCTCPCRFGKMEEPAKCAPGLSVSDEFSKPVVSLQTAQTLLLRLYAIRPSEIKGYPSYDDVTYHVKTAPDQGIEGQTDFIFKVLNATVTSHGPGAVGTQMAVLKHLKNFPELRCQVPVATIDGKLLSFEMIRNDWQQEMRSQDALSAVRMYRYIPGQVVWDVSPLPLPFFYRAGRHLGDLQLALQTFPGDTGPLKQKISAHIFCLENVPHLEPYLGLVQDSSRRLLVQKVIAEFKRTIVPVQGELRKGIVHHDFNEYNVLVAPSAPSNEGQEYPGQTLNSYDICGVIDFDEMVYTCLVYEIAISMMYMGMCSDQPLEAMAYLLAGFESRAPLLPAERRLLRTLTCARYAQSIVLGLRTAKLHPDNTYVGSTQINGWSRLELLWSKSEEELMEHWDSIATALTV